MVGSLIGGAIDPDKIYGPRLTDAKQQTALDGVPRSWGYGTFPTAGNIIWTDKYKEHKNKDNGKGGPVQITYTYTRSYAIGVCRGPIAGFLLVKRNGKIVFDARTDAELSALGYTSKEISETRAAQSKFVQTAKFYYGDDSQLPDPTMEAVKGSGNVPAYRGTAYIVLKDDDVTELQAACAQFEFVVSVCGTLDPGGGGGDSVSWLATSADGAYLRRAPSYDDWSATPEIINLGAFSWSAGDVIQMYRDGTEVLILGAGGVSGSSSSVRSTNGGNTWADLAITTRSSSGPSCKFNGKWYISSGTINDAYTLDGATVATIAIKTPSFATDGAFLYSIGYTGIPGNSGLVVRDASLAIVASNNTQVASDGFLLYGAGDRQVETGPGYVVFVRPTADLSGVFVWRSTGAGATLSLVTLPALTVTAVSHALRIKYRNGMWFISYFNRLFYGADIDAMTLSVHVFPAEIRGFDFDGQSLAVGMNGPQIETSQDFETFTPKTVSNSPPGNAIKDLLALGAVGFYSGDPIPDAPGYYVEVGTGIVRGPTGPTIDQCVTTLDEIVADVCESRNVTTYDVIELTDVVIGQRNASQTSAQQVIASLMPGYMFDGAEYDGFLHFPKRGATASFAITADDLVARDGDAIEWTRVQEAELLRKVTVGYIDPATTYTTTTQNWERRTGTILAEGEGTIELPVVGTKDWAKQAAEMNGKVAWAETDTCKFSLTVEWAALAPAQVGTLTDKAGITYRIRITRIQDEGGVRMIEATRERANTYNSSAVGIGSIKPQFPGSTLIGPTDLVLMNLPAGLTADDSAGIYWAARGYLSGWTGTTLQVDRSTVWTTIGVMTGPCTMGSLTASLATASRDFTDTTHTLSVDIGTGNTLLSVTADQVYAGANSAAILYANGTAEILQFQTATATGDGTYDLTTLQRGRLDTTTGTHAIGARFVLLDDSVRFASLDPADLGATLTMRAVSNGTDPDAADTQTITLTALESAREWSVANLAASRDGSNNVTVTWDGRPRLGTNVQPIQSTHFTGYRVKYTSGGTTITSNVARTPLVIVGGVVDTDEVTTHTYTAAEQTIDFGSVPGSLAITVSAVNDITGAGPTESISA